ncbi:SCO6745 family protein [Streptomyces chattanoogensis]|uniref:SCO6745 family protein n=1 Tax=Streptomyces chattanoogensis TaxID=66876 RepID=UPI0036C87E82
MELRARSLWLLTEPLHAVTYFDEECRGLGKALGLKGFWMGYFASRTAPLGAVEPSLATAVLGVFAPGMVARALPAAWSIAGPAHVLEERARRAADALRRIHPGLDGAATELSGPLLTVVENAPTVARPLFAANRALCDHADPVERLWQLSTAVREFRGDAHLAVLAGEELDGCEALVLAVAAGRVPKDTMRQDRGWSEEDWAAATDRLRSRGLVDERGDATDRGRRERTRIEAETDRLTEPLLRPLTGPETDRLLEGLEGVVRRILAADVLPFPNPIGLPHPDEDQSRDPSG